MKDRSFVDKMLFIDEPEKVQGYLEDNYVDLSLEEIIAMGNSIRNIISGDLTESGIEEAFSCYPADELFEDELESVSGGKMNPTMFGIAAAIGFCNGIGIRSVEKYWPGGCKVIGEAVRINSDRGLNEIEWSKTW